MFDQVLQTTADSLAQVEALQTTADSLTQVVKATEASWVSLVSSAWFQVVTFGAIFVVLALAAVLGAWASHSRAFERFWKPVADKISQASQESKAEVESAAKTALGQIEDTCRTVRTEVIRLGDHARALADRTEGSGTAGDRTKGGGIEIAGPAEPGAVGTSDRQLSDEHIRARALLDHGTPDSRDKAREMYLKLVEGERPDALVFIEASSLLIDQKDYERARDVALRGVAIYSKELRLTHNYGVALYHCQEYAEAATQLQKCAAGHFTDPRTYHFLGLALYQQEQYEEALRVTEHGVGLAQDPKDVVVLAKCLHNIAYYLFAIALGKVGGDPVANQLPRGNGWGKAMELVDEAFAKMPPADLSPNFYDTRGCVRLWHGDVEGAYQDFGKAIEMTAAKGAVKDLYVAHRSWAIALRKRDQKG